MDGAAPLILDGVGKFQRKEERPDCIKCKLSAHEGGDLICWAHPPTGTVILMPAKPPRMGLQPQVVSAYPVVQPVEKGCGEFVERLAPGKIKNWTEGMTAAGPQVSYTGQKGDAA